MTALNQGQGTTLSLKFNKLKIPCRPNTRAAHTVLVPMIDRRCSMSSRLWSRCYLQEGFLRLSRPMSSTQLNYSPQSDTCILHTSIQTYFNHTHTHTHTYTSSSSLLHVSCVISSQFSLLDPLNHPHWSLFSNHQLTPVSRSQAAPSGMPHLTCGTGFLLHFVFLISSILQLQLQSQLFSIVIL